MVGTAGQLGQMGQEYKLVHVNQDLSRASVLGISD